MQDEQIAQNFIGHEKDIELFEQWLTTTDPAAPWILFFHDAFDEPAKKGGVGKTWLLRKCAALAKQREGMAVVMVDFFSVTDRDDVTIAQRITESLQATYPQWSPASFLGVLAEYNQAVGENREVAGISARLHTALAQDMELLNQWLGDSGKRLLVFFDTFELIERYPTLAVAGAGYAHTHTFPDTFHFKHMGAVIAGRNAPDWTHPNWKGREHEVQCVPIAPFSLEEMVQFVNANCTAIPPLETQSEQATALYVRTQGRPILIGLVTDVLNHQVMPLHQLLQVPSLNFERYLVTQINNLARPINWVVLFMAHIYHRFNPAMLQWIFSHSVPIKELLQDINAEALAEKLLELSFVRISGSGDNLALHDEMCRLVNTYNWPAQDRGTGQYRRELSAVILQYYEHAITPSLNEQLRQAYIVEMLYHQFFVDTNKGFTFFEQHFKRAIALWQTAFARSLLQEAQKFSEQFSQEQSYNLMMNEALLLGREENSEAALEIYRQLELKADKAWLKAHEADILFEKGDCYQRTRNFSEAIACFTKSLELTTNESRAASILIRLGTIHRRLGELEQARAYYERSISIYQKHKNQRGYAEALTSISVLYRLQGKLEEALRRSMVAWRIRQDLHKKGTASEIGVAHSLNAIGAVYLKLGDLVNAQKFFQDAYDIYKRANYRAGIARMYNRFGQIAMARYELSVANKWFTDAYQASLEVDIDTEINSLNKQGWVQVLLGHLEASIPFFTQAIERASAIHDYYQQAESLVDLADVLERLKRNDEAQHALQEAETISKRYNYFYLLGLSEVAQGEIRYNTGKHQEAFHYLGRGCYYMALYNPVEYEKTVRQVVKMLLALPQAEISAILNDLLAYWSSVELGEQKSLLLGALEEVALLMGL